MNLDRIERNNMYIIPPTHCVLEFLMIILNVRLLSIVSYLHLNFFGYIAKQKEPLIFLSKNT